MLHAMLLCDERLGCLAKNACDEEERARTCSDLAGDVYKPICAKRAWPRSALVYTCLSASCVQCPLSYNASGHTLHRSVYILYKRMLCIL